MLTLNKEHISLMPGRKEKLVASESGVTWTVDHQLLRINQNGEVWAIADSPTGVYSTGPQGKVIATKGADEVECDVTIVSWGANRRILEQVSTYGNYNISKDLSGNLYVTTSTSINIYDANGGFNNLVKIGELPTNDILRPFPLLHTPHGVFFRNASQIYHSTDLQNWELLVDDMIVGRLWHTFDFYHDTANDIVYVFASEYTVDSSERKHIHRIKSYSNGTFDIDTPLWFYSEDENSVDPELDTVRHFHVVTTDKSNGWVWVGTGDAGDHARIYLSKDLGNTWELVGSGSQQWRVLSIWFSDKYIYWNMDTFHPQYLLRLKRTNIDEQISSGGKEERYAPLEDGEHWFHLKASHKGQDFAVMANAMHSARRDQRCRLFCIKEMSNEMVLIEELKASEVQTAGLAQWEPRLQDDDGNLYAYAREIQPEGLWKMRFVSTPRVELNVKVPDTFALPDNFQVPSAMSESTHWM